MEKLKAKLLTFELSLCVYLRYDCQNGIFTIGLFLTGGQKRARTFYFFFFKLCLSVVENTVLPIRFWRLERV